MTFGKTGPARFGEYREPHFGNTSQDMIATDYTRAEGSSAGGFTSPGRLQGQSSIDGLLRSTARGTTADQDYGQMEDFKMFLQKTTAARLELSMLGEEGTAEAAGS